MIWMKTLKGILVGLLMFSVLFFCFTGYVEYLAGNVHDFIGLLPWLSILAYLIYVVSGLIASAYCGRQHILVGSATGFFSGLVASLIFGVGVGIKGVASTLVLGTVLGVIGGALCKFAMRLRSGSSNKRLWFNLSVKLS